MTSRTELRHSENWYLTIDHDPASEPWPAMRPYESATYEFRPDRISLSITRDSNRLHPDISASISGLRLRKDGSTGSLRVSHSAYRNPPAWAVIEIEAARSKHNLTKEALERP
jgi:hypothetical protein